jgi:hypothetical protein
MVTSPQEGYWAIFCRGREKYGGVSLISREEKEGSLGL